MSPTAALISDAATLIEGEGAWTQGARARDTGGKTVDPLGEEAVAWDLCGALIRCGDVDRAAIRAVNYIYPMQPLAGWNDAYGRTQVEAVERLREAAARIEEANGR